jgi:glycosyltransferase involved in cell wall biosynthesis
MMSAFGTPSAAETTTLTIIIPAYNEGSSIGAVLAALHEHVPQVIDEVIVVNDASTDNTAAVAQATGARVIQHRTNRGYGGSLKTGIRAAKTDYVLIMDSDGQHRVEDALALWQQRDTADMVVGQRTALLHSPLWRMPGKWVLGRLANYIVQRSIPDLNSGLRLMRRTDVLRYMHLCPNGFSFTTTLTIAFFTQGFTVAYVPIQIQKRVGKSTVSVSTGFQTLMLILRLAALFAPLRVFIPMSILSGLVGIGWGVPFALSGRGVSVGAMLAIVTAILLFALGIICDQISQLRLERYEE